MTIPKQLINKEKGRNIIQKYKNTLYDIFNTKFYQFLREYYVPTSKRFKIVKKENGITTAIGSHIQPKLPNKEISVYPFALLRQFILQKDDISIYRIGKHIKSLGITEDYQKYLKIRENFEHFIKRFCGVHLRNCDEDGEIRKEKKLTTMELIDGLFYGDIFHRKDDQVPLEDIESWNKIIEYFLRILIYICQISRIIKFKEEIKDICCEYCPDRILNGDCYGIRKGYKLSF